MTKVEKNIYFCGVGSKNNSMYEYISGKVAELAPAYAVVETGGVGYYLNISLQTYAAVEGSEEAKL